MSLFRKTVVKTAVITALVGGSLAPVAASAAVMPYKQVVAERVDLSSKVRDLQRKMRPAGHAIARPVRKAAIWVDHNMSVPALLLLLVFGGVFVLMGTSSPESRSGGYH